MKGDKISFIKNIFLRLFAPRSDASKPQGIERWSDQASLLADWDSRTRQIGALVKPGESVIEFGAARMTLRDALPEGCRYTPSDLVDRGENTLVIDLNGTLPELPAHYGVAVFSGVLEYIEDVPRLLRWLHGHADRIITSYAAVENHRGMKPSDRRQKGWQTDYDTAEILKIFEAGGFECVHREMWRSQTIFVFQKTERTE